MARLQDRYRHLDERQGLVAVGRLPIADAQRAVTRSLPTMQRAREVVDRAIALLGDRGYVDPAGGDAHTIVHLRDPVHDEWLVAEPLIHLALVPTSHVAMAFTVSDPLLPEHAPDGWQPGDPPYEARDPEPVIFPRGEAMRAGELKIAEGPAFFAVTYDDRGLWKETNESAADTFTMGRYARSRPYTIDPSARPPTPCPIGLLARDDLDVHGHTAARFAEMIVELRPWDQSPGRVHVSTPLPGGVKHAWRRGLFALREALYAGRVPAGARFAVADALDGTAVACGATLDAAMSAWNAELFRAKPSAPQASNAPASPARAPDPPEQHRNDKGEITSMSTGTIDLRGPDYGSWIPWPAAVPARIPRVHVALPPLPDVPPAFAQRGFDRWTWLLGIHGDVSLALARTESDGATLIGEGIVDVVDPEALDAGLDSADTEEQAMLPDALRDAAAGPGVRYYSGWDAGHQRRTPFRCVGFTASDRFDARNLDGDRVRWGVARVRERPR